ncbi:MAG: flavin reductase [Planctomycetaceae bacterium]|nr:flavin reductase [Planctomycetaceae bacterium]
MVGFAMAKTSYSGDLIRANKKAVLAMPTEELAEATMACGGSAGRNTDKVTKFAIDMQPLDGSAIQIPVHCCLAIACSITEVVEVGDHYLYIGAVDGIRGDLGKKALFAWDKDSVSLRPAR